MSTKASDVNPTWKQENVDTSFLQNQVKAKIVAKESKQKVVKEPVAHSYFLEYEQHKQSARTKAKDIKRNKAKRMGVEYQSSDEDDETNPTVASGSTYTGNFKTPPVSPAIRKKRKILAKKQKAKSFNESGHGHQDDDDSSDSSDDTTPRVRYNKDNKSPRGTTFTGIKNMKSKSFSPSPSSSAVSKKQKAAAKPSKVSPPKQAEDTESEEEEEKDEKKPNKTPTQENAENAEKTDTKPEFGVYDNIDYKINEIQLDFSHALSLKNGVFCLPLPTPDGVSCGGETVMYDMDERGREYFFVATDDEEEVIGIMRYDIAQQEWCKFVDYPAEFSPDLHGNCVHIAERKLYIFDRKQFGVFDLRTKQWTMAMANEKMSAQLQRRQRQQTHSDTMSSISKIANEYDPVMQQQQQQQVDVDGSMLECQGLQSAYLPAPINEIHVFARTTIPPSTYHLLLDAERKYVVLRGFDRDELMRGYKMCYNAAVRKLLVCGGQKQDEYGESWIDADHVWLCDVVSARQMRTGYNWRRLRLRLPYGGKTFAVVSVFGSIVVLIYLRDNERKEIYCLDLLQKNEQEYKFVKSTQTFPFEGDCEYTDVVVTTQSNIHCMDFSNTVGHCVLNAAHIIPAEMKLKYKRRFETMAVGFCRRNVEQKIFEKLSENVQRAIAVYLCQLCL